MKKIFQNFTKVVEIVPPLDMKGFYKNIKVLKDAGINTVSIASNPLGKPKLPALYVAQYLIDKGFKVIVHYPVSGRSEVIIKSDILQAISMGVEIMLVLSGDSHGGQFKSGMNVIDTIKLVKSYEDILIGVAVDPNKIDHIYLKEKVEAGADYFQTQSIFTINQTLQFLKDMKQYDLPILLGMMIPKSKEHIEKLLKIPDIVIPEDYLSSINKIPDENFIDYILLRTNTIINAVKNDIDGIYLSMPQSMFNYLKDIK